MIGLAASFFLTFITVNWYAKRFAANKKAKDH